MAKYNDEFRLKVLKYDQEHGTRPTARKFNVSRKTIYRWHNRMKGNIFMRKKREVLSKEEKMDILNYFFKHGYTETEKKFNVNIGTINNWEKNYRLYGIHGLDTKPGRPSLEKKKLSEDEDLMKELQRLRYENEYLKKLDALIREEEKKENKK